MTLSSPDLLTPDEDAILRALCRVMLPADDVTPDADELGVADVILAKMVGAPHLRPLYIGGLRATGAVSRARHGRSFGDLIPSEQEALVADLERNAVPPDLWPGGNSVPFFLLVRSDVHFVFTTDPQVHASIGFPGPSIPSGGYPNAD